MADASGRAIILPVEIDLDSATGQLRTLKQVVSTEATQSARILEQSLAATERQTNAAAKSAMTWQDALRGANPAISGVTQAVRAMGAEVSPVLSGISHSLVSMVSGGFTPLGAAIALATGALMLWNSKQADAAELTRKQTEEIEKQRDAYMELVRATESAAAKSGTAIRAGIDKTTPEAIELQRQIDARRAALADMEANRPTGRDASIAERIRVVQAQDAFAVRKSQLEEEIRLLERALRTRQLIDAREASRPLVDERRKADAARSRGTIPPDFMGYGDLSAFVPGELERLQDEERIRREQYQRGQKEAEAYAEGFFSQQEREQEDRYRFIGGMESAAPGGDRVTGYIGTNPQRVRTYAQEIDRQFQASAESGLISGIQMALSDPSNWRGALQSFAQALQQAVTQRMAQGLADALMGHGDMFGAGGLLGLFQGATATTGETLVPGATPGSTYNAEGLIEPMVGAAKMSSDSLRTQPIAVVNVWDEATADAVGSKMSAQGARVVMARAMGVGVSAGTVPSRRRG